MVFGVVPEIFTAYAEIKRAYSTKNTVIRRKQQGQRTNRACNQSMLPLRTMLIWGEEIHPEYPSSPSSSRQSYLCSRSARDSLLLPFRVKLQLKTILIEVHDCILPKKLSAASKNLLNSL